jgi:hypothetical protein
MTMADVEFTTNPRVSSADFLHATERAHADDKSDVKDAKDLVSVIEEALEEERTRLMLANSMLGCVQIALDPEAISVAPAVYFPEGVGAASPTHQHERQAARVRRDSPDAARLNGQCQLN